MGGLHGNDSARAAEAAGAGGGRHGKVRSDARVVVVGDVTFGSAFVVPSFRALPGWFREAIVIR